MGLLSPFIVLLIVTLFSVGCAIYIWKSPMKSNDKMIAIISLLSLMCIVTIINESKRYSGIKKVDKYEPLNYNILFFK